MSGYYSCGPNPCAPGIQANAPLDENYASSTFNLNTQILGNPNPISSVKAYLDDNVIAESS